MKSNTPFPFLRVSYDIKMYSSTPGLAGRNLNSFYSHAGALKKRTTLWDRVCNNALQPQPVVDSDSGLPLQVSSVLLCFLSSLSVSMCPVPSENSRKICILPNFQISPECLEQRSFLPGLCVIRAEADRVS